MDFLVIFLLMMGGYAGFLHFYNQYTIFHRKYKELVHDYNDVVNNRNRLKDLYLRLEKKHNMNVDDYNKLLKEYELVVKLKAREFTSKANFEDILKKDQKPVGKDEFSMAELKRIRFAIHPDKNGGKTGDLFIKVNEMLGE
ncbi:hypothetical protein HYQ09_gp023 [Acinetobacter phage vB_AbaM_Konradin]|uniref:Uncharacterized protein n=1 Tax=Acinetobacter phage vB_AbaM_Konradin TaxID=2666257 RepID=A0A650EUJ6_9CAUD|nr:hypothetical protein HYQ09_gp023 [Acinetobacter phage vB_AbaM_Konradin]QGT53787.1 hypothetical protein Konradin_024 [Acinetobacter phage vB_AbaM_Konradin]